MTPTPYSPADREACLSLFDARAGTFFHPSERESFVDYLDSLEHPEDVEEDLAFWTFSQDGQTIACGGFEVLDRCAYLCWGIVHPDRAGQGLGRTLLQFRIAQIKAWPIPIDSIFSDTAPLTEGFYAKFGFQTFFRKPDHWAPGVHLVAMELPLTSTPQGPRRITPQNTLTYRLSPQ